MLLLSEVIGKVVTLDMVEIAGDCSALDCSRHSLGANNLPIAESLTFFDGENFQTHVDTFRSVWTISNYNIDSGKVKINQAERTNERTYERTYKGTNKRTNEHTNERKNVLTNERTNVRPNERTNDRIKGSNRRRGLIE